MVSGSRARRTACTAAQAPLKPPPTISSDASDTLDQCRDALPDADAHRRDGALATRLLELADRASLLPLLSGPEPEDWRKSIYYHYHEVGEHAVPPHYGVRTERYKLIYFYTLDEWELFDLETDPRELKSVYADSAYSAIT